jgi:NADH dehydrogenase
MGWTRRGQSRGDLNRENDSVRIVVLGGGFGGVATARHLERALRGNTGAEITLVSGENFFVITPLLFEACSGRLELRHCAQPIRAALRRARFVEATVESVDAERQIVRAVAAEGATYNLPYDHLVVAVVATRLHAVDL